MEELKPGDLVTLKSGGTLMTIEEISSVDPEKPYAVCSWFYQGEHKRENISVVALKKYSKPKVGGRMF